MIYILMVFASGFFALALHESAHVIVAAFFRIKVKKVRFNWRTGLGIEREAGAPFDNMIVSLAGPLTNLSFAALLWGVHSDFAWCMWIGNLAIGLINLLPVKGSDGHRAWQCWRTVESHNDGVQQIEYLYGARGTGKAALHVRQALTWLKENPTGVLRLWSCSHESAKAMYERIKLAGGDVSRVQINV